MRNLVLLRRWSPWRVRIATRKETRKITERFFTRKVKPVEGKTSYLTESGLGSAPRPPGSWHRCNVSSHCGSSSRLPLILSTTSRPIEEFVIEETFEAIWVKWSSGCMPWFSILTHSVFISETEPTTLFYFWNNLEILLPLTLPNW